MLINELLKIAQEGVRISLKVLPFDGFAGTEDGILSNPCTIFVKTPNGQGYLMIEENVLFMFNSAINARKYIDGLYNLLTIEVGMGLLDL